MVFLRASPRQDRDGAGRERCAEIVVGQRAKGAPASGAARIFRGHGSPRIGPCTRCLTRRGRASDAGPRYEAGLGGAGLDGGVRVAPPAGAAGRARSLRFVGRSAGRVRPCPPSRRAGRRPYSRRRRRGGGAGTSPRAARSPPLVRDPRARPALVTPGAGADGPDRTPRRTGGLHRPACPCEPVDRNLATVAHDAVRRRRVRCAHPPVAPSMHPRRGGTPRRHRAPRGDAP